MAAGRRRAGMSAKSAGGDLLLRNANLSATVEVWRVELSCMQASTRDETSSGFRLRDASFHPESQGCSPPASVVFASSTTGTWAPGRQPVHEKEVAQRSVVAISATVEGSAPSVAGNAEQAWRPRE